MAGIIKGSINLSEIPKDKIIEGKKGKYLPISITILKLIFTASCLDMKWFLL